MSAMTEEQLEAVKVAGVGWCSEQTFSDICEELQERRKERGMSQVDQAWARDADAASRAAHNAWKAWIVGQGYADHAWPGGDFLYYDRADQQDHCCLLANGQVNTHSGEGWLDGACRKICERHHPDMVPWDSLPEEKRGKYRDSAKAGYLLGFKVGAKNLDVMSLVLRDLLGALEPHIQERWMLNHELEPLIARARRILE